MSDPLVDARELLRGQHSHNVEYILFGALATIFYDSFGPPRISTSLSTRTARPSTRVADWLISINAMLKLNPAPAFGPRERWGMHKSANATVISSMGQIDVDQRLPALPDWSRLLEEAELCQIDALRVPVINRLTLIDLKRRRSSHLDLAEIEAIERLAEL